MEIVVLNDAQIKAVSHKSGPLLVVAGAGTGKTKVIVERFVKLIDDGTDKSSILAVTFTEKATQEMLDRISEQLPGSYGVELNIFTFNGLGHVLLQESATEIGLSNQQRLIGESGKIVVLREHLDELGLDYFAPISKPDAQLVDIAEYFSKLKQQLIKPERYAKYAAKLHAKNEEEKLEKQRHTELAHAYATYNQILRKQNLIDYDDQIYLTVELLEQRPNIRKTLQDRFKYIMVDEFQDTNPMQSRMIDLLANDQQNLMVVGDDDQSIYGWRGATLQNILSFSEHYPKAKEISLIDNYRNTQSILDGAWKLIQHNNPDRLEAMRKLDKKLRSHTGKGSKITSRTFVQLPYELSWVAEDIKQKLDEGVDPGTIAVLARGKSAVSKVHEMLAAVGVEHTVIGLSEDLYSQQIIRNIVEGLRVIADPDDNTSLYHTLIGPLFNCDPEALSQASLTAKKIHSSLYKDLQSSMDRRIQHSLKTLKTLHESAANKTIREVAYALIDSSGLKDELYATAQHDEAAANDVQTLGQWFSALSDFEKATTMPSLQSYLNNFESIKAEGETLNDQTQEIPSTMPVVMTIHKAKGLEWSVVYVVDLLEKSFPLQNRSSSLTIPDELATASSADEHYSEERRLMYVAATRAKDELILTHSESHNGSTKRTPSRFIEEMLGETDLQKTDVDVKNVIELQAPAVNTSVSLPASMLENDNIVLTASQADDYLVCPLNFYYKYVLNVPEPPSASAAVGSLFHGIIQQMNEAKIHDRRFPELKKLQAELTKGWPQYGYDSKKQLERARDHAVSSLARLHERMQDEASPLHVEHPFRIKIPDSALVLSGRIDAIFQNEQGIEIRDYKTSTAVQSEKQAKQRATNSSQLVMYAIAWNEMNHELPTTVSLDFVQTGYIGTVAKQKKSIDNMKLKLKEVAENIQAGKFPPGNRHEYCLHPIM